MAISSLFSSRWSVLLPVVLYLTLTTALVFVQKPSEDDMQHVNVAWNLIERGKVADTILDPGDDPRLQKVDDRTYGQMPGVYFLLGPWCKVFGVGLFQMRFFNAFVGLIGLLLWPSVFRRMGFSDPVAVGLAALLLSVDFIYTRFATCRPFEIVVLTLMAASFWSYLRYREESLPKAILLSQTFTAISGLVHPNGLIVWAQMTFLILYLDRGNLKLRHAVPYAIPYLAGGLAYLAYIMKDFATWKIAFFGNAAMSGVQSGFLDQLTGTLRMEFLHAYGWADALPPAARALVLVLAIYLAAYAILAVQARQERSVRILFVLTAIQFFFFTWVITHKWTQYVTFFIPFFSMAAAWAWRRLPGAPAKAFAGALCLSMLLSLGVNAHRVRKNEYRNKYGADMTALKAVLAPEDTIFSPPEIGFAVGMERVLGDYTLGYFNKQERNVFVTDSSGFLMGLYETTRPEIYAHIQEKLKAYDLVHEGTLYRIYKKRNPTR